MSYKLITQQLKNTIRSLSDQEVDTILKIYENSTGIYFDKQIKIISYKCYEASFACQNKRANGYGRNEQEAVTNCIKNLLEHLIDDENNFQIIMKAIKKNHYPNDANTNLSCNAGMTSNINTGANLNTSITINNNPNNSINQLHRGTSIALSSGSSINEQMNYNMGLNGSLIYNQESNTNNGYYDKKGDIHIDQLNKSIGNISIMSNTKINDNVTNLAENEINDSMVNVIYGDDIKKNYIQHKPSLSGQCLRTTATTTSTTTVKPPQNTNNYSGIMMPNHIQYISPNVEIPNLYHKNQNNKPNQNLIILEQNNLSQANINNITQYPFIHNSYNHQTSNSQQFKSDQNYEILNYDDNFNSKPSGANIPSFNQLSSNYDSNKITGLTNKSNSYKDVYNLSPITHTTSQLCNASVNQSLNLNTLDFQDKNKQTIITNATVNGCDCQCAIELLKAQQKIENLEKKLRLIAEENKILKFLSGDKDKDSKKNDADINIINDNSITGKSSLKNYVNASVDYGYHGPNHNPEDCEEDIIEKNQLKNLEIVKKSRSQSVVIHSKKKSINNQGCKTPNDETDKENIISQIEKKDIKKLIPKLRLDMLPNYHLKNIKPLNIANNSILNSQSSSCNIQSNSINNQSSIYNTPSINNIHATKYVKN